MTGRTDNAAFSPLDSKDMRRVLIVESEPYLGALLGSRFEQCGYDVRLLLGQLPEGFCDSFVPDIIVLGEHDPVMFAPLRQQFLEAPVIVIGEPSEAFPAWLYPNLQKPFSPNELVELASRYLQAQKLRYSGEAFPFVPGSGLIS